MSAAAVGRLYRRPGSTLANLLLPFALLNMASACVCGEIYMFVLCRPVFEGLSQQGDCKSTLIFMLILMVEGSSGLRPLLLHPCHTSTFLPDEDLRVFYADADILVFFTLICQTHICILAKWRSAFINLYLIIHV